MKKNDITNFGEFLKYIRLENNLSQRELANKINISKSYINKMENGEVKKPNIIILTKIAKELNTSFNDLILKTNYTEEEMTALQTFGNINTWFNILGEEREKEFSIIDENGNERISIIKLLDAYKNNDITTNEILGLLSIVLNTNVYNYISQKEIDNYNLEDIIKGWKKD